MFKSSNMNKRNIIINSVLLFSGAYLLQGTLHELAHFISAIMLHSKDVYLFHNYVKHDASDISMTSHLIIAGAGPVFSLITGLIFHYICSVYKKRNLPFLFHTYMATFGYINFGGYLLVSPFFAGGDTGFVFTQLGFPLWLKIIFALGGVVFLFFSIKMLCRYYVEMATTDIIENKASRSVFIANLIQYPLYIGIVVTVLLELPVPTFLSLIYPMCSPFTLFWVYGYFLDAKYPLDKASKNMDKLNNISIASIAFFLLIVAINRVLVYGFHFN